MLTSLTYSNTDGTRIAIVERNDGDDPPPNWTVRCGDVLHEWHYLMGSLHDCQRIARQWVQTGQVTR